MKNVARVAVTAATGVLLGAAALGGVAEAAAPAPVTGLNAQVDETVFVTTSWTDSVDTDTAQLCYREGTTPPVSPADVEATCNPPTSANGDFFKGAQDTTYALSVFAVNTTTHETSAPASTTVTTGHYPPMVAAGLFSRAIDRHQLRLHWTGDNDDGEIPANATVSWVITMVPGTSPAPSGTTPTAVIPRAGFDESYVATGLQARRPYTFTVQGKNAQGELSTPRSWTAGTRTLGLRVRDTAAAGPSVLPATRDRDTLNAVDITSGHTRVAFTNGKRNRVYFAQRSTTSAWSTPVQLGSDSISVSAPLIAVSPRGAVAVAWRAATDMLVLRTKPAGSSTWNATQTFAHGSATNGVRGLAMDRQGRVHVLTATNSGTLRYRTNASGHWTNQLVADSSGDYARVAMTLDPMTNRVFVVAAHDGAAHEGHDADGFFGYNTQKVRVASASASATQLGAWHTWATYDEAGTARDHVVDIKPTITANDGVITVGLSAAAGFDTGVGGPGTGAFVMHGTSVSSRGAASRVAGSDAYATNLLVKAASAAKVALTWSSTSPTWDPAKHGVFVERTTHGTSGWTYGAAQHVDASHYGFPLAAAYGWGSHLFAAFAELDQDGRGF